MIIKSIQLCNFRQYKGAQKPIIFSTDNEKNVTVILGVNTSGKTTLIQAFRWCLYGEYNFKKGTLINAEVEEDMDVEASRDVFVEIVLIHEGREYVVRREQKFKKTNHRTIKKDESILKVEYKEDNGECQPISPAERADTIEKILPMALSDYFFFDGERISDINNRGDVVAAVRGLMGIDVIGEARDRLDPNRAASVTSKFEKELDLGNDDRAIQLQNLIIQAKERRENLINRRDEAKEQIEFFERRKLEIGSKFRENQHTKQLQQGREKLEKDIRIANENIDEFEQRLKDNFAKESLHFFAQPLIARAFHVMENSKQDEAGIPDMRQSAVDYILNRNRCLCGCDLAENEGARKRIIHERDLLPPQSIGTSIRDFRIHLDNFRMDVDEFGETTRQDYVTYKSNLNYIDEKRAELKNISEEMAKTGNVDIVKIETDFRNNEKLLLEKKQDKERFIAEIGEVEGTIKQLEKEIAGLVESTRKNKSIQRYIAYSKAVFQFFDSEHRKKEAEVKKHLLESVNQIFSKMYHGQRSVDINDKYQITLLASLGSSQLSTEESKGLEAVKNFSFITGLVDLARQKLRDRDLADDIEAEIVNSIEPIPLVMDAPFSNADEIHISRIASIVPSIAEQVILIVMRKDWEFARKSLQDRVGKIYTIEKVNNSETNSIIRGGEDYV